MDQQKLPPAVAAGGRATIYVALSACGFGSIAILVTLATRAGAPLFALLTWRYTLAALVLGGIALVARKPGSPREALRLVLIGGFFQSLIAFISLSALRYIPAATLSFLFYTYPAWVAVIARARRIEPLTKTRLAALAMSLAGIFVMVGAPGSASLRPLGVVLALASALMYAAYIPIIGALQRNVSDVAAAFYVSVGAAVALAIAGAARGDLMVRLAPVSWWVVVGLALISTVAAFLLFLHGLRILGPVRTAIVSTVEPFFTALAGAAFLAQPLTFMVMAGGVLIAGAVVLLQLRLAQNDAAP